MINTFDHYRSNKTKLTIFVTEVLNGNVKFNVLQSIDVGDIPKAYDMPISDFERGVESGDLIYDETQTQVYTYYNKNKIKQINTQKSWEQQPQKQKEEKNKTSSQLPESNSQMGLEL